MNHPVPRPTVLRLTRWVAGRAVRRPAAVAGVLAATLARAGLDALKPWPTVLLVDCVLGARPWPAAVHPWIGFLPGAPDAAALAGWSVAATVLLFLAAWAAGLAQEYASLSLAQRMVYDLGAEVFGRLQQLSLRFHGGTSPGDITRRVTTDCGCVGAIVRDALLPVISGLISLAVMLVILWQLSPRLTTVALVAAPCMALVFRWHARPMLDQSAQQQAAEGAVSSLVEETLSALPAVQAWGCEERRQQTLRDRHQQVIGATLSLTRVQLRFKVFMGLVTAAATACILWWGAAQALAGQATVGTIVLFLSYLAALYVPMQSVIYTSVIIQGAAGSAQRVWQVLLAPGEVRSRPGAPPLRWTAGTVRLDAVTTGYEPGRPVLRRVSLEACPGEIVALVGPSGAGKSTLLSLVPRFLDPWEGRVLVDGQDIREVDLRSLRRRIGLVTQEPFLFPQSVAANIAYGRPGATRREIEAAARDACAHEFIQGLPRGYDTLLGERGATLSFGQRQRLAMARALLTHAPILLFDEPTSALDAATEQACLDALIRLAPGRTILIIAHRLSTARRASRIVVLRQGEIVETGTHEQLVAAGGFYAAACVGQLARPVP